MTITHAPPRGAHNAPSLAAPTDLARTALSLPFDLVRASYASAVTLGLVKRSILGSRDVEHLADAMERFALGPLARRC